MADLFSNPMVAQALKSLSKQQLEDYKKMGESMYGSVNFDDSTIIRNMAPDFDEAVAYVESGIKAGLLPCDLDEDEVNCLFNAYGETWYERYGWTRDESPQPGLSLKLKEELDEAVAEKIAEVNSIRDAKAAAGPTVKAQERKEIRDKSFSGGASSTGSSRVNNKKAKKRAKALADATALYSF